LNVVANEKIIRSKIFENVILNGSVEDNGTAIGAALSVSSNLNEKRSTSTITDYYGKSYTKSECLESLINFPLIYEVLDEAAFLDKVAQYIATDHIVGWFQNRSEFGPRALGNRSILANPASKNVKSYLDLSMKSRDRYRPYAPVIIEEFASDYFDLTGPSPVMMRNSKVLNCNLDAIIHKDGCARVQTVTKEYNPNLYNLLIRVRDKTGFPILLNTSFNLPGEPIVETPTDALNSFTKGSLDILCLGNIIVQRP
jgi:carbamoyltransferase